MHKRLAIALACCGSLAACEIPTVFPSWEVTIRVPAMEDSVKVVDFLPQNVRIENDVFVFDSWTGEGGIYAEKVCEACRVRDGQMGYYPAFVYEDTFAIALGEGFESTVLQDGRLEFAILHELPYALLRSDEGVTGYVSLELLTATGEILASDRIEGIENPFEPGPNNAISLTLDLRNVTVRPDMRLVTKIESPGSGQETLRVLNSKASISYTATLSDAKTPFVVIRRDSASFNASPTSFDLDQEIRERLSNPVAQAVVAIEVEQPFEIDGTMSIGFYRSKADAQLERNEVARHAFELVPRIIKTKVVLTQNEIRELLGPDYREGGIFIRYGGQFQSSKPTDFVVRATDQIRYSAQLDIDLIINQDN